MNMIHPWDLFASAWLAKNGVPMQHGEDESKFAGRQAEMAALVADRMMQHRRARSQPQTRTSQQPPQLPSASAADEVPSGLDGGFAPPPQEARVAQPAETPTAAQLAGQPCWRAFNGKQRGQGEDCYGRYDEQGVCKVCRLAYKMPGDPPRVFSPAYGPPPIGAPSAGAAVPIQPAAQAIAPLESGSPNGAAS